MWGFAILLLIAFVVLRFNAVGAQAKPKDCVEGKGFDYTGTVAVTKSGKKCHNWSTATKAIWAKDSNFPDGSKEAAKNYCRNPDKYEGGVWCYFGWNWEVCNVPACGDGSESGRPKTDKFQANINFEGRLISIQQGGGWKLVSKDCSPQRPSGQIPGTPAPRTGTPRGPPPHRTTSPSNNTAGRGPHGDGGPSGRPTNARDPYPTASTRQKQGLDSSIKAMLKAGTRISVHGQIYMDRSGLISFESDECNPAGTGAPGPKRPIGPQPPPGRQGS